MSDIPEVDPDFEKLQLSWGLPEEPLTEHRLFYNNQANCIVLACDLIRDGIAYGRLYTRSLFEKRYRSVLNELGEEHSLYCPLVCQAPIVFFLVSKWVRNGDMVFDQFLGVARLDLLTGERDVWNTDVSGPNRCFVSELSGIGDADGLELYALVGFRAADGIGRVDYQMSRLDWNRRKIDKLAPLEAVFF